VYQGDMGDFMSYRRDVEFHPCEEGDILPLIPQLTFIHNKRKLGVSVFDAVFLLEVVYC
jgi:hypothetical protein